MLFGEGEMTGSRMGIKHKYYIISICYVIFCVRCQGLTPSPLGTQDENVIEKVIRLSSKQYFEIKIFWADDTDRKGTINLQIQDQQQRVQELVRIVQ